ncbi:MAG: DUF362 domain-containing protein [Alphaproteobacteria bacterium]|nr:DUF362 domain-containing protein [Alphaproteobacteria bacterium]
METNPKNGFDMNRREILKSFALVLAGGLVINNVPGIAGAIVFGKKKGEQRQDIDPLKGIEENSDNKPDIVAIRNGEPDEMFRKGIEEFGGMKAFIKPGQKVIIKPNASFDSAPEYSANTNPILVGEIVRQALAAGASEVSVFDHTLNDWRSSYKNSGIEDAVRKAGGRMLPANEENLYEKISNHKAKRLKETALFKPLLDADVIINVPVLKNHGGAKMTCAIKNLMGYIWDRRYLHSNDLNQCIAELPLYIKPTLTIVDAYRVMLSNGPRGTGLSDVELIKYQLISPDMVALDSIAAQIMKYNLDEVSYIKIAEDLGFGTSDIKKLNIKRIDV